MFFPIFLPLQTLFSVVSWGVSLVTKPLRCVGRILKKTTTFKPSQNQFTTLQRLIKSFIIATGFWGWFVAAFGIARAVRLERFSGFLWLHTPPALTDPITINPFGIVLAVFNFLLLIIDVIWDAFVSLMLTWFPQVQSLTVLLHIPHQIPFPHFLDLFSLQTQFRPVDFLLFGGTLEEFYATINDGMGIFAIALVTALIIGSITWLLTKDVVEEVAKMVNQYRANELIRTIEKLESQINAVEVRELSYEQQDRISPYLQLQITQAFYLD